MKLRVDPNKKPCPLGNKARPLEPRRGSNLGTRFGIPSMQAELEGGIQLGNTAAPNRVWRAVHILAVFRNPGKHGLLSREQQMTS